MPKKLTFNALAKELGIPPTPTGFSAFICGLKEARICLQNEVDDANSNLDQLRKVLKADSLPTHPVDLAEYLKHRKGETDNLRAGKDNALNRARQHAELIIAIARFIGTKA